MLQIFGIRHHGPGSSKALQRALDFYQPDCILIEAPADAAGVLNHALNPGLLPPVAILVYNSQNLEQASFIPFAGFSPEWVAIQWGLQRNIPVRFMDLPLYFSFALQEKDLPKMQLELAETTDHPTLKAATDPMSYLARLAGYTDSERWWEVTFEQQDNEIAIFDSIAAMISLLRETHPDTRPDTLLREAFMREAIRKSRKEGFERVAAICGAWHVPALQKWNLIKSAQDKALWKGLKKEKTQATWIAWSYQRLSFQSGYGAGVHSPAWYDLLFHQPNDAVSTWMTRVAQMLRREDMDASTAHVLDAVRLAQTLATLQKHTLPGIDNLKEAAYATMGYGHPEILNWIEEKLIVGDKVGEVPDDIPATPLQQDFEKCVKSARLSKERKSSGKVEKKLDLRKDSNLAASQLLHRLSILEIPWGKALKGSEKATGSFSESWLLEWFPDYAILLIEAGSLGNTLEEAATAKLLQLAKQKEDHLPSLSQMTLAAILGSLPHAIGGLSTLLQNSAAHTTDTIHLGDAINPLVQIMRYGSVHQTDKSIVEQILQSLVPRFCLGLPNACADLDEEASELVAGQIHEVHHSLHVWNQNDFLEAWWQSLRIISTSRQINGLLKGTATRLLFDKSILPLEEVTRRMFFQLSAGSSAKESAAWIEGFLFDGGLLLIHHPELWQILDTFVSEIEQGRFQEILPLLRRTFSNFTASERTKIMEMVAGHPNTSTSLLPSSAGQGPSWALLNTLGQLLGNS